MTVQCARRQLAKWGQCSDWAVHKNRHQAIRCDGIRHVLSMNRNSVDDGVLRKSCNICQEAKT